MRVLTMRATGLRRCESRWMMMRRGLGLGDFQPDSGVVVAAAAVAADPGPEVEAMIAGGHTWLLIEEE